jgi:hypothetical protein
MINVFKGNCMRWQKWWFILFVVLGGLVVTDFVIRVAFTDHDVFANIGLLFVAFILVGSGVIVLRSRGKTE